MPLPLFLISAGSAISATTARLAGASLARGAWARFGPWAVSFARTKAGRFIGASVQKAPGWGWMALELSSLYDVVVPNEGEAIDPAIRKEMISQQLSTVVEAGLITSFIARMPSIAILAKVPVFKGLRAFSRLRGKRVDISGKNLRPATVVADETKGFAVYIKGDDHADLFVDKAGKLMVSKRIRSSVEKATGHDILKAGSELAVLAGGAGFVASEMGEDTFDWFSEYLFYVGNVLKSITEEVDSSTVDEKPWPVVTDIDSIDSMDLTVLLDNPQFAMRKIHTHLGQDVDSREILRTLIKANLGLAAESTFSDEIRVINEEMGSTQKISASFSTPPASSKDESLASALREEAVEAASELDQINSKAETATDEEKAEYARKAKILSDRLKDLKAAREELGDVGDFTANKNETSGNSSLHFRS